MMTNSSKLTTGLMAILALALGALSCSQTETPALELPTFYSEEAVSQSRDLITQGYELLDSGFTDSAVAKFAEIDTVVPNGLVREYHTACAYGRAGDLDQGIMWLDRLVANGFDVPEQLEGDTDFESLKEDARFEPIVARAAANATAGSAAFAAGMPEYDSVPMTFATEEEYTEWADAQNRVLRNHRRIWTSNEYTAARIDFEAKKLACLRDLKANDTLFDYGLERVRAGASLVSLYEPWGTVSDLVVKEVDSYLASSPSDDGASEANYRAGLALSMKYDDEDPQSIAEFERAKPRLALVDEGSEFYGAARVLGVINQLRTPGTDEEVLGAEFKDLIAQYAAERNAYRIISTQYGKDAVRMLWPIPIDIEDIDGRMVSLDEYDGKVLLIDFWATWCPPCRAELPNILEVYEEFHPAGFEIVSISLDYETETPLDAYRTWIGEHDMDWRHTYDGQGWDTELVKRYYVSSIPAPFLVGADGSLLAWGEDLRGESLRAKVEEALGMIGS
ncbi:MAG: TlpA family protein disulfide reductase [Candidatus Zixiibacteriota bacterium]|nr:MAG: TlpA family protein disulfide reductase [candidate division Zixibacteria bacterium]